MTIMPVQQLSHNSLKGKLNLPAKRTRIHTGKKTPESTTFHSEIFQIPDQFLVERLLQLQFSCREIGVPFLHEYIFKTSTR